MYYDCRKNEDNWETHKFSYMNKKYKFGEQRKTWQGYQNSGFRNLKYISKRQTLFKGYNHNTTITHRKINVVIP